MKPEFIGSLARFGLAALSTYLMSKGVSQDNVTNVVDLIDTIALPAILGSASIAWSYKTHKSSSLPVPTPIPESVSFDSPTPKPPKGYTLSDRSLSVLATVDKRLQELMTTAIIDSPFDFTIYHGLRTQAQQDEFIRAGKSTVKRSKHQDGLAVDFYINKNGVADWQDYPAYIAVANHIKECASRLNTPIIYGGDWKTFKDYVHIELA